MKLETQRLILQDLTKNEIEILPKLINDLEISKWLAVVPYPYTKEDAKWFINKCFNYHISNIHDDFLFFF